MMGIAWRVSFEEKAPTDARGRFDRKESEFRDRVTADGSSGFEAASGRYHLYVAWACPWAHRTLLARKLLGLEHAISFSVVHPIMDDEGAWWFRPEEGYEDPVNGADSLQEVYRRADPSYGGIGTVPVLWDRKRQTIVNNESREILRMLDTEFGAFQRNERTLLPAGMEASVDRILDQIYEPINNGVYRAGFARTQEAHAEAVTELFDALAHWDDVLARQRYLAGDVLTEADVCMFTTLLRFDSVYHYHFKCNLRRLVEFEHLWAYTREIHQMPGVRDTLDLNETKRHYYGSHKMLNPRGIIPLGPELDWDAPHGRDALRAAQPAQRR
jgi:glutathionyl-hydroquinone reductase